MNHLKNLTFASMLMLCIPFGFWLTGYQWSLHDTTDYWLNDTVLIVLTQTASLPYAYVSIVLIMAIIMMLADRWYHWKVLLCLCLLSLLGTQLAQVSLKQLFATPRPYVMAMAQSGQLQQHGLTTSSFYQLPKPSRAKLVQHISAPPNKAPLMEYQATELGYSFPSGHTIFTVSWWLLAVGLLAHSRTAISIMIQAAFMLWAAVVLYSRVRLGVHYPIDLFASIWIAWLWHIFLFWQCLPWATKRFQAA